MYDYNWKPYTYDSKIDLKRIFKIFSVQNQLTITFSTALVYDKKKDFYEYLIFNILLHT